MNNVKSPCNKICEMDYNTGFCEGCNRTIEEISKWSSMTELEKLRVLEEIQVRKDQIKLNG